MRDIFVSEGFGRGVAASRVAFGPDGKVYMTVGGAIRSQTTGLRAQDPGEHVGKVLRLNDDGSAPDDNPFVGEPGYLPEIYSMGHRNQLGLTFHPENGTVWASENAPQGGDEVNVILPGRNYGWPIASDGREYTGVRVSDTPWLAEFERPEILWWPSIAPSGLTFYDGEHFPAWRGNLFVGSMTVGRMQRTGHLERVVFNRRGEEMGREWLLGELKQRIRDVRQGPDGYLYVLTEEDNAALLRIEPARAVTGLPGSVQPHRRLREPRIPPLPATEWTNAQRALVDRYAPDGNPGNALRTLVRVPALADRIFPFMHYVANESTLAPRHREILILRTAWLAQNAYIWAAHAARAAEAGLTPEEILSTAEGPSQGALGAVRRRARGPGGPVVRQLVGQRRDLGPSLRAVRRPQPDRRGRDGRRYHHALDPVQRTRRPAGRRHAGAPAGGRRGLPGGGPCARARAGRAASRAGRGLRAPGPPARSAATRRWPMPGTRTPAT